MVRLMVLALLAGPAAAGCFGPPEPKKVTFNGQVVEILSHTAQDLTYRSTLADGSTAVMTTRNGLFPLNSSSHGVTYSYEWVSTLPDAAALVPGGSASYQADLTVEHATRSFFRVDLQVLRADVVRLGACDYPVMVVRRTDVLNGQTQDATTLWLSPALKFALRVETTVAGKTQTHQVMGLE